MSEEDIREHARVVAAEEVASQLKTVNKTMAFKSLRNLIILSFTIISTTWSAAWIVNTTLHDLKDSTNRIEGALNYKVSETQFTSWANALDKQNRNKLPGGLEVPDPAAYKEPKP